MSGLVAQQRPTEADQDRGAVQRILVVDDSRAQRKILTSSLNRQGFKVVEAESGEEALEICRHQAVDLVLSDWMMPGMDGLELCRAFRDLPREEYGYFILLTSKNEKGAVARGLDVGADDFLPKPVNAEELRARIRAGERILDMQRELQENNRLVSATLAEIRTLYDALDRDLIEARRMQQSLVRERHRDFGALDVSLLLKPCGHVGGDLVGFYRAGPGRVAVYSIDVSGHGIASALLTARLASYLSDGVPEQNIGLVHDDDGQYVARPPAEVATLLNVLMLEEMQSEHYFTLLLAHVDLESGRVDLAQCGHPNPAILRAGGQVEYFGDGGMPIGLIADAEFETQSLQLRPGDRFLLYSDGFTECADDTGALLDEDGFAKLLERNTDLSAGEFFEALVWDLDVFCGTRDFTDDLSGAMIAYRGPQPAT